MKLQCEQCGTHYNVSDDRVRGEGRVFKFRCRNCDAIITFHGAGGGAPQAEGSSEATWYYVLDGQQNGPVPLSTVRDAVAAGTVTADTYVWRAGMENWLPLKDVDELASLRPDELSDDAVRRLDTAEAMAAVAAGDLHGSDAGAKDASSAAAASSSNAPAAAQSPREAEPPAPSAIDGTLDRLFVGDLQKEAAKSSQGSKPAAQAAGGDMFGPAPTSDDDDSGDVFSSTSKRGAKSGSYQRHDNSVLFSLNDLDEKKGGGGSSSKKRSPSALAAPVSSSASAPLGGDSGLIDIRSFSKKKKDDKAGDLFGDLSIPAGAPRPDPIPLATGPASVPILAKKKKGKGGMIAGIILGAAAIAGGTAFAVIQFTKDKTPPAPVAQVVAPPAPAAPAAPAPAPAVAQAPAAPVAAAPVPAAPAAPVVAAAVPAAVPAAPEAPAAPVPAVPAAEGAAPTAPAAAPTEAPAAPAAPVAPVEKKELTPEQKKKAEEARKKREEEKKAADEAKAAAKAAEATKVVEAPKAPPAIDPNKLLGETVAVAPKPEAAAESGDGGDLPDSLTTAQVNKVVKGAGGRIRSCVTGAGESNVTVTVAFTITPGGGVTGVSVSGTGATGCVSGAISSLGFPKSKNGRSARMPFTIKE